VVEVVEHAASHRQVEQVTAGQRLRIDLDAGGAMVLQDDLRERDGVGGGAVGRDRVDLDVVGARHGSSTSWRLRERVELDLFGRVLRSRCSSSGAQGRGSECS
jgi:hypothetical protein